MMVPKDRLYCDDGAASREGIRHGPDVECHDSTPTIAWDKVESFLELRNITLEKKFRQVEDCIASQRNTLTANWS